MSASSVPPRQPPRYIPTLTEVVQAPSTSASPAPEKPVARAEADVLDLDLAAPAQSPPPSLPSFLRAGPPLPREASPSGPPGPHALFGAWSLPEAGPISGAAAAPAAPVAGPVPSPEALLQQASDAFTRELQQQMALWLTHWCERNAESWARQWAEAAAPMMREAMQTALRQALAQEPPPSGGVWNSAGTAHK